VAPIPQSPVWLTPQRGGPVSLSPVDGQSDHGPRLRRVRPGRRTLGFGATETNCECRLELRTVFHRFSVNLRQSIPTCRSVPILIAGGGGRGGHEDGDVPGPRRAPLRDPTVSARRALSGSTTSRAGRCRPSGTSMGWDTCLAMRKTLCLTSSCRLEKRGCHGNGREGPYIGSSG